MSLEKCLYGTVPDLGRPRSLYDIMIASICGALWVNANRLMHGGNRTDRVLTPKENELHLSRLSVRAPAQTLGALVQPRERLAKAIYCPAPCARCARLATVQQ